MMRSFFHFSSALLLVFLCIAAAVSAADEQAQLEQALTLKPDLVSGKKTYILCAACHGNDGLGLQGGVFPSIAGQHQNIILKQLFDIQQKKRINPTMFPFSDMKTLGGLQGMVDVAAYTAKLKPGNDYTIGEGKHLDSGQALYESRCITCHGQTGEGNEALYYPRVNKQHYPYLVRELRWIRDNIRKNADPVMIQILQDLSDQDIESIADYLSRLP